MRFSPRARPAFRLRAVLVASLAVCSGGLRAQSSTDTDSGLSRTVGNNPFGTNLTGSQSDYQTAPVPVFFPPEPPPLDPIVRRAAPHVSSPRHAPAELAACAAEPFYSVLGAQIDRGTLSARKHDLVRRYHDDKNLLAHNFRTELNYILAQPAEARPPLFAALAQKIDPPILALEARAEEIRSDLYRSEFAWTGARKSPLTDKATSRAGNSPDDIARVMLGAAYFQAGLSAAQRALLREVAIELMRSAESVEDATATQPYAFFSPGPSRVMFPAELPDAVAAKLATYQTKKSTLRKELYDAIYQEDATWLDVVRAHRFRALAEKQARQFAALDALAEEIRRELPPRPSPQPVATVVSLPSALIERIGALYDQQFVALHDINRQFEQFRTAEPTLKLVTTFNPDSRHYELKSHFRFPPGGPKSFEAAKARVDALEVEYDRVEVPMTEERNAIRRGLAAHLGTEDPARINLALADGLRFALDQKTADTMHDYQVAVLEPGLSPAERRLLFDSAVEALNLPLPNGVLQTSQRLQQPTASNER